MASNSETQERRTLRLKYQRLLTSYETLVKQGEITKNSFPGTQLSGGLNPPQPQIMKAREALENAKADLVQYDIAHPKK